MKKNMLFFYAISSLTLLFLIEQGLTVAYTTKTIAKIFLFGVIPFMLFYKKGLRFLLFKKVDRKSSSAALLLGISIMSIIVIAFIKLRIFIDIDALLIALANIGVTSSTFPFIALYILFGNSLLEEIFFRGFLTSFFIRTSARVLIPSFLFAVYHMTIFLTWFSAPLLLLAVVGLWIGGITFQLVNEKSETILPSWIIHLFADTGILVIGLYIFYFY